MPGVRHDVFLPEADDEIEHDHMTLQSYGGSFKFKYCRKPEPPRISLCTEDDDIMQISASDVSFPTAFENMNELRRNGQLCDVVLISEGRKLSAHRVILASMIPFFRAMFTSDMVESKQNEVTMNDLDWETLEQLVQYAYTGLLRISTGNVQSIMIGANFLQLDSVVMKCAEFIRERINVNNVLLVRSFLMTLGCKKEPESFLQKHFMNVSQTDEFLKLDLSDVLELLSMDNIYVDSEVDEAKDYHLMPERRPRLLKSFVMKPRCCTTVPGLVFAIGGLTLNAESSAVEMYVPYENRWKAVKSMPSLRSRVGVAVHERRVYVIGGFSGEDRLRTVEMFDYSLQEWKLCAPLEKKRSALGAVFVDDKLYVCGGYDGVTSLATVEVYHPDRDLWAPGPSMSKQRSAAGVAVLDGYLYVMGGHDGMSIFNTVERFCVEKDTWEPMPPMLSKRCRLGACAYKGKIYVAGGYDGSQFLNSVECFDPTVMEWAIVSSLSIKRSRVSLVANGPLLYAIGGYDGTSNLSSMEVFNDEDSKWNLAPPLTMHEGGVGVGVIPLPPDQL